MQSKSAHSVSRLSCSQGAFVAPPNQKFVLPYTVPDSFHAPAILIFPYQLHLNLSNHHPRGPSIPRSITREPFRLLKNHQHNFDIQIYSSCLWPTISSSLVEPRLHCCLSVLTLTRFELFSPRSSPLRQLLPESRCNSKRRRRYLYHQQQELRSVVFFWRYLA